MLLWLKKHYSQIAQKNWYSCELSDESMLRPCSKEVKQQLKEEKKQRLEKVIQQLGLVESKNQNGEKVLKNNIPIRKEITLKQTNNLIKKLHTNKSSSFACSMTNQAKSDGVKQWQRQNIKNQSKQKVKVIRGGRPFHQL